MRCRKSSRQGEPRADEQHRRTDRVTYLFSTEPAGSPALSLTSTERHDPTQLSPGHARAPAQPLGAGVMAIYSGVGHTSHTGEPMKHSIAWNQVTNADVLRAIEEYDRLGPERFFSEHGFAPATTYELVSGERRYPPKAILGTAYEFATGQRLASGDFEGGKTGAVRVLGKLGFTVQHAQPRA
jgi:hypothetical protein